MSQRSQFENTFGCKKGITKMFGVCAGLSTEVNETLKSNFSREDPDRFSDVDNTPICVLLSKNL